MDRRIVSLWLPSFAADRLTQRLIRKRPSAGDWRARPLALVLEAGGGILLAAANETAVAGGARPGMALADARAVLPGLLAFAADLQGDRDALAGLADWCLRYTPWTAVDATAANPGAAGLWLDVTGCAHLFGGEDRMLEDCVRRLANLGLSVRAAAADTAGAAWAVARFAAGKGPYTVVPAGRAAAMLAPLPVAGLRLSPATADGLHAVGLRTIGDLAALPRAPLAARFGGSVLRRLDQALGRLDEPISPLRPAPVLRLRLAFPEPVARREDIALALHRLLGALCERLENAHEGARRLEFVLFRADGTTARVAIGTSRPVRDPDHLERLFRDKLETLDAGFGADAVLLAAAAVDPLAPHQTELAAPGETRDEDAERRRAELVDRLGNRLGADGVVRLVALPSHMPERACREVSALADAMAPPPAGATAGGPSTPRPLHLLPCPEPIEAVAPVPDDPPVMFLWRRVRHRVVRAAGPERIGPEWWLEEPGAIACQHQRARDYYRVEDGEGRRFWLYREGLYRPDVRPRWYLHGFFA